MLLAFLFHCPGSYRYILNTSMVPVDHKSIRNIPIIQQYISIVNELCLKCITIFWWYFCRSNPCGVGVILLIEIWPPFSANKLLSWCDTVPSAHPIPTAVLITTPWQRISCMNDWTRPSSTFPSSSVQPLFLHGRAVISKPSSPLRFWKFYPSEICRYTVCSLHVDISTSPSSYNSE